MLTLDTRSREPIYTQIEKQIIKLINLGVYEQNSPLPSVRSLALELGINPNTVARAYKNLEQNGVIYTIAGKGAFISSSDLKSVRSIVQKGIEKTLLDAKNSGLTKKEAINIINTIWEGDESD